MHPLNQDFIRLLGLSGWNKADAARHLELSAAVITRYVNGETKPSLTVLKLFKLLLGDLKPLKGEYAANASTTDERPMDLAERQLVAQLRELDNKQRRILTQSFLNVLKAVKK